MYMHTDDIKPSESRRNFRERINSTILYLLLLPAFLILFNALTSFLILASRILYLPLTPVGLPLTPLLTPLATTIFFSLAFSLPLAARASILLTCLAFSPSPISSLSMTPSAFFLAFSILATAFIFFLPLASATFLMGLASNALCRARRASTASLVIGMLGL